MLVSPHRPPLTGEGMSCTKVERLGLGRTKGRGGQAMNETCKNGHPRVKPDGTSNVYVYPPRPGRKPRITCRTCRDGEPVEGPSQEKRVARLAEREVAKVVPKKLNDHGELRFWGMCRGICLERYPLRMAWLMAQLSP